MGDPREIDDDRARFEAAVARLVAQGVPRERAEELAAIEPGNWAPDVIGRPIDGAGPGTPKDAPGGPEAGGGSGGESRP